MFDLLAALFAERITERLDRFAVRHGRYPDQSAAVEIDDDSQIALTLAMRHLIGPEPSQAVEQIDLLLGLVADAFTDRAGRPPRDTHQLRGLRCVDGQPRCLVLKRPRETARGGHAQGPLAGDHAMTATAHPRRAGLDERQGRPEIQRAPPPPGSTGDQTLDTDAGRPRTDHAPASPAAPPQRSLAHRRPHVLERPPAADQAVRPRLCSAHVVSAPCDSWLREAGNLGAARRAPSNIPSPLTHGNNRNRPTGPAGQQCQDHPPRPRQGRTCAHRAGSERHPLDTRSQQRSSQRAFALLIVKASSYRRTFGVRFVRRSVASVVISARQ